MAVKKTQTDFMNLDAGGRIRVAILGALRMLLVLTASFLFYFLIPIGGFNESNPAAAWIRLSGVVLAFLTILGFQVRVVVTARVPQVQAVEAVVQSVVVFILLFALLYLSLSATDTSNFSEPLDRVGALYFTSSTFATVGFGDITPVTSLARGLVSIQMIAGLGVLVMVAKLAFFAARKGLGREV
ncbi:potassium channel family protein [Paeniglutamicibacter kerguelensis]|uniref:Potassium channel domain-containing protein n=1 Tax=Paeniglutamicibacter kerguelensis TaxID=254788 RepID=A0ABS4XHW8_9MICC|nr:potassium channel family protein [Paeniglutamicibacter kerguelensis]MBP2388008.1 hypothetical protein [Paeniglutamicibacter kerguelensis]